MQSKKQSKDCYIYCLSEKFCPSLYKAFDADTCIAIYNPIKFLAAMSQGLYLGVGLFLRVDYINISGPHQKLYSYNPAHVKDLKYTHHAEWRCLWEPPTNHNLEPFNSTNYQVAKFCRVHHTIDHTLSTKKLKIAIAF